MELSSEKCAHAQFQSIRGAPEFHQCISGRLLFLLVRKSSPRKGGWLAWSPCQFVVGPESVEMSEAPSVWLWSRIHAPLHYTHTPDRSKKGLFPGRAGLWVDCVMHTGPIWFQAAGAPGLRAEIKHPSPIAVMLPGTHSCWAAVGGCVGRGNQHSAHLLFIASLKSNPHGPQKVTCGGTMLSPALLFGMAWAFTNG